VFFSKVKYNKHSPPSNISDHARFSPHQAHYFVFFSGQRVAMAKTTILAAAKSKTTQEEIVSAGMRDHNWRVPLG